MTDPLLWVVEELVLPVLVPLIVALLTSLAMGSRQRRADAIERKWQSISELLIGVSKFVEIMANTPAAADSNLLQTNARSLSEEITTLGLQITGLFRIGSPFWLYQGADKVPSEDVQQRLTEFRKIADGEKLLDPDFRSGIRDRAVAAGRPFQYVELRDKQVELEDALKHALQRRFGRRFD